MDESAFLDDSNVRSDWQDMVQAKQTVVLKHRLASEASVFIERIKSKLAQDAQDATEFGEPKPANAAVESCLNLARKLAPHLVFAPRLKSGVFTEESGGISLVLQSLVTDRRLNCRIASDGSAVTAVMIDEHMIAKNQSVSLSDPNTPRDLAEWVTKRA